MYLAGLIGLNVPATATLFELLTPFNLLASLGLLLLFHTDWRPAFGLYCIAAFSLGFLAEVLGVHTGLLFGEYSYGTVLGWKVAEVPLIIGTNWLMLTYLCGSVVDRLPLRVPLKVLLAAGLMTLLDVLIEPVAVHMGFWEWHTDTIPLSNYLGWYGVSAVVFLLFYLLPFRKTNLLAPLLLLLQFLFFGLNGVALLLG
ncbi:carotenoid biosynthesis protein [Cytophagaceae bacterium SJW1-29]|uniref:Carotenoid biosynthesis protein n=2 Tax=Salmonirosea aquatica TaxID=2654236 RepID=A0A7C9BH61_9BACT|nr:carotenoid biosynthesis protein [Cytophagaceae bacterium SJW1-29]